MNICLYLIPKIDIHINTFVNVQFTTSRDAGRQRLVEEKKKDENTQNEEAAPWENEEIQQKKAPAQTKISRRDSQKERANAREPKRESERA